jgi:hypothetical protein
MDDIIFLYFYNIFSLYINLYIHSQTNIGYSLFKKKNHIYLLLYPVNKNKVFMLFYKNITFS